MSESKAVARTATVLLVGGFGAVPLALLFRRIGDFDLPWHLASGRAIVATRSIPRVDDFAYTHRPIQYTEFVSDVVLYAVQRLGDAFALQLFGAVAGLALGLLLWGLTRRYRAVSPLVVATALGTMNAWLIVRPATLSFVLLAGLLALLEAHRRANEPVGARRLLAAVIPMQLLWVNTHGFALVGLAIVVVYALFRTAARLAAGRVPALLPPSDGRDAPFACAIAAAASAVSLLNPAGHRFFLGPFRAANDFGSVTEWASTTPAFLFTEQPGAILLAVLVVASFAFGRDPDTQSRIPNLLDLCLVGCAVLLGASAVRLLPVAAILVTPVVARRLASVVPSTALVRIAGSTAILLAAGTMALQSGTSHGVGFEPFHFPEGAVQHIRTSGLRGNMWNFFPFGGYLIWRLYPEHRVLTDGRSGWVHDPDLVRRVNESDRNPRALDALVREYDIQWAIVRAAEGEAFGSSFAASRQWQMVYWDDVSAIYVRLDGENRALGEGGYRILRHQIPPGQALAIAVLGKPDARALALDGILATAQAPESPRAAFFEACGAIAVRDGEMMQRARNRLASLSPRHPALVALDAAWRQVESVSSR